MRRTALIALALGAVLAAATPASAAWQAPETVAANPLDDIRDAHAAGGAAGEVVVTWETSGHRYLRVRSADGSWSSATDLGATSNHAALASDAAGNALVVWTADNGDVMAVRRPAGGPTPTPAVVAPGGGSDIAAAIDGSTAVIALPGRLLRSEDAGANWTSASVSSLGAHPTAAVRRGGEAIVAWIASGRLQAVAWPDGGTPGAPTAVSDALHWAAAPDLAIDADGDALVAWAEAGPGYASPVKAASRPAGGAWGAPVAAGGTTATSSGPRVAITPAGHAFVTWQGIYDGIPVGAGYTSGSAQIADGTVTPLSLGAPVPFGGGATGLALLADGRGALAASGTSSTRGLRVLRVSPTGAGATPESGVCPPIYTEPQSVVRAGSATAILWLQANIVLDRHALLLSSDAGSPGSMAGDCVDHPPRVVQSPSPVPVGQPVHLELVDGVDPDAAHTEIFWQLNGETMAGSGIPTGSVPSIDTVMHTPGLVAATVEVDTENSYGRGRGSFIPFSISVCTACPSGGGGGGGGGSSSGPPPGPSTPTAPVAPTPPAVTPAPPVSSTTVPPVATAAPLTLTVPSTPTLAAVRRDGLRLALDAAHTTRVRLEVRLGGDVVGVQRLRIAAGVPQTVVVKLDRAGRKALRHRSLLVVRLVPPAGSSLTALERRVRVG